MGNRGGGPACRPKVLLAGAALVVAGTAGCASATRYAGPPGPPAVLAGVASPVPGVSPRPLGAADTAFGLDLLRVWCRGDPASNLVFSPASLATGLGLAYLGARGATATAMARVLHLPVVTGPALEADLRARQAALGRLDGPGVTLAASNRVWASIRPLRGYTDAVATSYGAGLDALPASPVRAARVIDAAVDRDTRGHIPSLVTPAQVAVDAWVLTDALYLDAAWARPFAASQTEPGPFATAAGGTATASYLHGGGYRYAAADGWTAVELPYRGGRLALTALLPPAAGRGCQVPSASLLDKVTAAASGPAPRGRPAPGPPGTLPRLLPGGPDPGLAAVALPKVSLRTQQDVSSLLVRLGMGIAFSAAADFTALSPMAGQISSVEHAATLQVGERGTVGSAATAVGITMSAEPALTGPVIDFDRPYLLLVRATATGEPLFMARVADPAAG